MSPRRVQKRCWEKGWQAPPNSVYVGRRTYWQNPAVVMRARGGGWAVTHDRHPVAAMFATKVAAARLAVEIFRSGAVSDPAYRRHIVAALMGRDLMCWCPLADPEGRPYPCHADVLLEIANREEVA